MKILKRMVFALLILAFMPGLSVARNKSAHRITHSKPKHKVVKSNNFCGPSQIRQNQEADREGLERIADSKRLRELIAKGELVPLQENEHLIIDPRLNTEWRFVLPRTKTFLFKLGRDFYEALGKKLQINSAVRTIKRQEEIRELERNGNAARSTGYCATTHTTGATIDISKIKPKKLSRAELHWIRTYLERMRVRKLIEYREERNQAVFHIMVFKSYIAQK